MLKADGKPRTSDRIHPYKNDDYPAPRPGKRHRQEALRLGTPVENILRRFSRDLNVVLARGIRKMFAIALAQYKKALNDRSLLDFSDVLQHAVDLLGRMDEFSQSRYRLEGRYHHVLVDEFQDTSRKQWELVSLLVKAWGEGMGLATQPSIFIVGDRKQSIYRFRDADVAVLKEAGRLHRRAAPGLDRAPLDRAQLPRGARAAGVRQRSVRRDGRERAPPRRLQVRRRRPLSRRRRSRRSCEAASRTGAARSASSPAPTPTSAPRRSPRRSRASCARRRCATSRPASRAPRRPGDIGILFRSRASHREFESALEAAGIPTYVYKGLGFFDADEIKDLSALIRFLANPSSELRAAAFLRSRFVRLSDTALARLREDASAGWPGAGPRPRREPPAAHARRCSDDDRRGARTGAPSRARGGSRRSIASLPPI